MLSDLHLLISTNKTPQAVSENINFVINETPIMEDKNSIDYVLKSWNLEHLIPHFKGIIIIIENLFYCNLQLFVL